MFWRKCAKIKIAPSVQIEKCAKYLQHQYIPIYSIYYGHIKITEQIIVLLWAGTHVFYIFLYFLKVMVDTSDIWWTKLVIWGNTCSLLAVDWKFDTLNLIHRNDIYQFLILKYSWVKHIFPIARKEIPNNDKLPVIDKNWTHKFIFLYAHWNGSNKM